MATKTIKKKHKNSSTTTKTKKASSKTTVAPSAAKKKRKKKSLNQAQLNQSKKKSQQSSLTKKKNRKKLSSKKKKKLKRKKKLKQLGIELLITLGAATLILSLLLYFGFSFPKMEGYGMNTTLNDHDRLVVFKWKEVKRFSLVYFKDPRDGGVSIRRVIGSPGEEISYKNDELYINNQLVPERFLEGEVSKTKESGFLLTQDFTLKQVTGESRIPEGKYFLMGDNRQYATDSRKYGLIDEKDIIGVVGMRIFPLHSARSF